MAESSNNFLTSFQNRPTAMNYCKSVTTTETTSNCDISDEHTVKKPTKKAESVVLRSPRRFADTQKTFHTANLAAVEADFVPEVNTTVIALVANGPGVAGTSGQNYQKPNVPRYR